MGDWKRWLPPLIAAALIVIGLLALDWFVIDQPLGARLHVRPRGGEVCVGAAGCTGMLTGSGTFRFLTWLTFWMGLVSAAALVVLVGVRFGGLETDPIERLVGWACGGVAMLTVLSHFAFAPALRDLRAGGAVALVGALVGALARATIERGVFEIGRSAQPLRSSAVASGPPPGAGRAVPPPPSAYELEQAQRKQAVAAGRASATGTAGVDATRAALRFVVASASFDDAGVTVRDRKGVPRVVAWDQLVEVRTRRLPPDPPYEKTQFVDLLVAGAPPVRLVPTTRVDWSVLPTGMAPNTKENWRRLIALARERHPALAIEADSAEFFAGGRDAPMFRTIKEFVDYDARLA